mmetsp:Transcript_11700/g.17682  ORF Transcript_11700/g.17682 Transcript_11700/m.17682 type:complete len:394 (+) Transcript_11700:54-1235(+)
MSSITPDTKKKKIALPSVLSNIRNAVGRAGAEEKGGKSEVEIRPLLGNRSSGDLVGMGKSSSYAADRSQMRDRSTVPSSGLPPPPLSAASSPLFGLGQSSRQTLPPRNATSASVNNWSATLQTYSERIGSQWRKRNRQDSNNERRRHRGVTINTQPILIVLGLFFIGFPILLTLFLLARKAVFGDEGVDNVAKHEVPAHEVLNYGLDTGVSPIEGEEAGITAAQVLNDLKQLTSEDNPLGSVENDIETMNMKDGSFNEADTIEVDANVAVVSNEAIINEENQEVAAKSERMGNASNLRGSTKEAISSPDVNQQDSHAVMDNGGVVDSNVDNEKQSALQPPGEMIVDSTSVKEMTDEVSMTGDQIINGGSTAVDIVAEEDEKPLTNNEVIDAGV